MKAQRLTLVIASLLAAGAALYFYVSSKQEPDSAANDTDPGDFDAGPQHAPLRTNGPRLFRHAIHEAKLLSAARQEELHKAEHSH